MLDRYWWGRVNRISPEAPVPIVFLERTTVNLGGAANVAANVEGLGATPILAGIVGADAEADLFTRRLSEKNISSDFLIKSANSQTIVKTRIVAHSQQVVRIDQESKLVLDAEEKKVFWNGLEKSLDRMDMIIISDYGKGTITEDLAVRLITTAKKNNIKILIDPKGKDYRKYSGATLLKPNRSEIAEVCQLESTDQTTLVAAGQKMLEELSLEAILITQGEDGMTLIEKNKPVLYIPGTARQVYDVTGAGDTVIAGAAVALSGGANYAEAAQFASICAGLVVEEIGTTAISKRMLENLSNERTA